jgi:hypothetical protein
MITKTFGTIAILAFAGRLWAEDLLCFQCNGRVLAFRESDLNPVSATIDQTAAANIAIGWAHKYYQRSDLDVVGIDFRMRPTRFWLVRLATMRSTHPKIVYVVVLPDGSVLEPTARQRV